MRKISSKKRILAVVLSVLMVTLGLPLQAQAASSDWSQLANKAGGIQWIYGNLNPSKSVYVEGMSVPQRLILENIKPTGGEHYVDFEHQFTKGGYYAYDFITGWDQANEAAQDYIGQTWDDSWIGELEYSVDIPFTTNDHSGDQEDAYEVVYGERTVRLYSSEPVTKAAITMNNTLQGSESGDSSLGFTVSWEGDAENVVILYASHIAIGDDSAMGWGAGKGAGGISGSPYHNYLTSSSEWSGKSSKDNQLSIEDVVVNISGMKWGDADGDGIKDSGEDGLKGWQIWADLNGNGSLDNSEPSTLTGSNGKYSLNVLLAEKNNNKVRIYETQKSGFTQTYPSDKLYHEFILKQGDADITDVNFGNFQRMPKIEVTKTANPLTMAEPGGVFTYTYVVKNIGNVPVKLTSVHDDIIGEITLPSDVNLQPQESTAAMTATHTYDDDGKYKNIVTATAEDEGGNEVSDKDEATVEVTDTKPSITVTKVASPASLPKGGGVFTYKFVVTNNGLVPVTVISVQDDVLGNITLPANVELAPGESTEEMTATSIHTESGTHSNVVIATAKDDDGNEDTAVAVASVVVSDSDSSITVTKTASPLTLPEPGGEFTYTYKITNNGNIPVTIINVHDDVIGNISLPTNSLLEAGDFIELTGKYTYTDDGTYKNIVTVTAKDSNQKELKVETSAEVTVTDTKPLISVTKTASPTSMTVPGGEFTYKFEVENTGTVPVTLTRVYDNVFGEIELPEDIHLLPGEKSAEMVVTATHTAAGTYRNTVTATAVDDDENTATSTADASVTVTEKFIPIYELAITKDADVEEYDEVNDVINYTINISNKGNSALTQVIVTDPMLGTLNGPTGDANENGELDTDEIWVYKGSYSVTQDDIARDFITNIAKAYSYETEEVEDSVTVNYDEPGGPTDNSRYRITIEKDADVREYSAEGDVINYTITLNNTGNRVLTGIKVTDPLLKTLDGPEGDSDNDKQLDLNETWIYTGSYAVTEADMLEDSIENTATADTNETGPVEDSVTVNKSEDEITIIPEPEVPEAGVPEIPEEIIEEQPVPQGTLPNTGRFFNTSMLAAIGSLLVISGLALNRKKRIKE